MADIADIVIRVDSTQLIGASAATQRLHQSTITLLASLSRAGAANVSYRREVQTLRQAQAQGIITNTELNRSLQQLQERYRQMGLVLNRNGILTQRSHNQINNFGMVSQQVGYQVGDFLVQVQSGADALVAFGQQGTQLAGLLPGIAGAIVGIGLSLATALGSAFLKAKGLTISFKKVGEDLSKSLEVISPLFDFIPKAINSIVQGFVTFGKVIAENFERAIVYAATFALMMATKVAYGFIVSGAAAAVFFKILRAGLIATGVGILVVALGEALLAINRLVDGAGSFSRAFSLVYDFVTEVSGRIGSRFDSLTASIASKWYSLVSDIATALDSALTSVVGFGNSAVGIFQGAIDAIKIIWGSLPSAIGDFAIQAANTMVESVESMLNAVTTRINSFITGLNSALALLPDWAVGQGGLSLKPLAPLDLPDIPNIYAGAGTAAGTAAAAAFSAAVNKTYIKAPQIFSDMSTAAEQTAVAYAEAARMLSKAGQAPLTTLTPLLDAFNAGKTPDGGIDPSTWLVPEPVKPKGKGSSDKTNLEKLIEQLALERELVGTSEEYRKVRTALAEEFKTTSPEIVAGLVQQATETQRLIDLDNQRKELLGTVKSSMEDAFMSMVDGTKSAKEAFKSMAAEIIKELYRVLVVKRLVESVSGALMPAAAPAGSVAPPPRPPGLATGGSMMANRAYMVGENGPELVIPRHSGSVVNANQTANAMGGSGNFTQNLSINVTGSDATMVRTEVAKMIPQITNATKAAVIDARLRGGQMKQAFR